MGVADYPIEITKMAKADRDVAAGLATDFALDSGKGISRIVGTGLKAPMDMTLNISRGFANVPRLYGDNVRDEEKVTGIVSGLGAAGKVSPRLLICILLKVSDGIRALDSVCMMVLQAWSLNL